MNTFIALFRGINVGGNNSLPMKTLKTILESLGCEKVRTYIQSGNAVFQSSVPDPVRLAETISAAISDKCGFEPRILLLKRTDLEEAVKHNPFPMDPGNRLHFFFLAEEPKHPDLEGLKLLKTGSESFQLFRKVFYLHAPDGIGRSKLAAGTERRLGVATTARNWNTVNKLMEMIRDIG